MEAKLVLKEDARPVFMKARPVPYAARKVVAETLDKMENDGIISKVESSRWGNTFI